MRTLSAARLLPLGLLSACLSTQDVSLGELELDATVLEDAAQTQPDAAEPSEPLEAGSPNLDRHDEREEEHEEEQHKDDAGPAPDAGVIDAGPADTSVADASAADAGHSEDASRASDAGSADPDARTDASRSDAGDGGLPLICTFEPWHCN